MQIVWSWRRGSRSIEHIGSAHDEVELAALKAAAAERLATGQTELDLGLSGGVEPGMLPIASSHMTHLWDGLCTAYRVLGFGLVTKDDNVFRDLVLARIIKTGDGSRSGSELEEGDRGGEVREDGILWEDCLYFSAESASLCVWDGCR